MQKLYKQYSRTLIILFISCLTIPKMTITQGAMTGQAIYKVPTNATC